ncbi:MAG: DUF6263 family protein [Verrucomicrobiota bacterium]
MKKQMKRAVVVAMLVGGVLTSGAVGQEAGLDTDRGAETLNFGYQVGKTYVQNMEMDQNSKIAMGGQEIDQKMNMDMEITMKVAEVPDSADKAVETEYTRVAMEMTTMGQEMKYDSADTSGANNPMLAGVGAMVGKSFTMILDEENQIKDVTGLDEIAGAAGGNPVTAEMMQQFLDKDQLGQMMNMWVTSSFPQEPVKPGDSWPVDVEWEMPKMGKVGYDGTYTLEGYKEYGGHDCAVIEMDAQLNMNFDGLAEGAGDEGMGAMMKQLGMKMTGGKTTGTIYWDNELGWMRGMEMDQTMTMSMMNPQTGEPMEIPMEQSTRVTVEVE